MKITIEAENDAERAALDASGIPHLQEWPMCYEFVVYGHSATRRVYRSHGDHEFLECSTEWLKRKLGRFAAEHLREAARRGENVS